MNPRPHFKPGVPPSKSRFILALAWSALSTILYQPPDLFAQGSLTPPGAPAPTMKSLDVIEARAPISSVPYEISSPGSYYLTANLNVSSGDAITISTNGVTLDLNGFTLSSTDPDNTGSGLLLGGNGRRQNVTVLNGFITGSVGFGGGYFGSGFASGIAYTGLAPYNVRVAGVSVSGCRLYGIYLNTGFSTVVESCTVQAVGGYGIVAASVSHSAAYLCGDTAIFANTASDCYGYCLGSGDGLSATTANNCYGYCTGEGGGVRATSAHNCYGYCTGSGVGAGGVIAGAAHNCYGYCTGNGGFGRGLDADVAINCVGESGGGDGLYATYSAAGCSGRSFSGGFGLNAATAQNCFGRSDSGLGLSASAAIGCFCISATGTGLNASIANSCVASSTDPAVHKFNMP
jgi:hypothetical protein